MSCVLFALAEPIAPWFFWPGVVFYSVGHTAWTAVANLAVITTVSTRQAGRASGIVMFGFLASCAVVVLWPTSRRARGASVAD